MPDAEVIAEAETGRETLDLCREHQPDLLLLDINMPELGGLDVLAERKHVSPSTKVAVLS